MKAALVATWTQPIPGRERKTLEYYAEVTEYWGRHAKEGRCSAPEAFLSERGVNMWMVKAERDTLVRLMATDEARLLSMKGDLLLKDFSLDLCHTGDAAEQFLATYLRAVETVG